MNLASLVIDAARESPDAPAVRAPDGALTYAQLDALANHLALDLRSRGIRPGDRVGIWLDKCTAAVGAMQAVLRLGAAYVPLDPMNPAARVGGILRDGGIRALVTTSVRAERVLLDDLASLPAILVETSSPTKTAPVEERVASHPVEADALAYVLYTSGSTGRPKGVCISHRNALAFVEWAAAAIEATSADRLANHAPFHFDLSVLDLYVAFLARACVTLIPDGMSYAPKRLVDLVAEERLTIWYSVPSVLMLMMNEGGLLDAETTTLRTILFAGEPFPIKQLQRLVSRWPSLRYWNLYGPTETNVCTAFEVDPVNETFERPLPIGRACSGDEVWARTDTGAMAGVGEEGELVVRGPTVMVGYWGQPPLAEPVYPTGDLVRLRPDGNYEYLGRRDHMVKVRGHRIELGEIETALAQQPSIDEAAVVVAGDGLSAKLVAFVVSRSEPTLLEVKRHCAERLPRYMIVDEVRRVEKLPRTRNGKVDRAQLTGETQR
jgi:amino acid adenylation domain-containing protein